MVKTHLFTIGEENAGMRVDKFLAGISDFGGCGLSRSRVQGLIKSGEVLVNGKSVKANYALSDRDSVEVKILEAKESELKPENIPLDVIYEDKDVIVVNKSAGMVTHPTDSGHNQTGTLVNALLYHCKDLSGIGGVLRPGIVHRLDKGTSGVLIVAKNDEAHRNLSRQIQDRKVEKVYLTLVRGRLVPEKGSIDAPVGRSLMNRKKMAVTEHGASRSALTHYEVKGYLVIDGVACSLVEVLIVTGRTHQIRVHFQAIGHPVIGDETYGDAKINAVFWKIGLRRPFLHAQKLGLVIPSSGKYQEFVAELSEDLRRVLS